MNRITKTRHQQKGVSAWGWLVIAAIFGFLLITFFRLFPMYYENFKVKTVLENLAQDQTIDVKSRRAIWDSLNKRFIVQDVKTVKREHIGMSRKDGKTTVTVKYEVQSDLVGNLTIGARFEDSVVINR